MPPLEKNSALRGGGLSHRFCDRSKNGGRELYGDGTVCGKRTVLDGKFFFYIYEPFFKNHYDNMARRDMTQMPYDMDKYPAYKYDEV